VARGEEDWVNDDGVNEVEGVNEDRVSAQGATAAIQLIIPSMTDRPVFMLVLLFVSLV